MDAVQVGPWALQYHHGALWADMIRPYPLTDVAEAVLRSVLESFCREHPLTHFVVGPMFGSCHCSDAQARALCHRIREAYKEAHS